MIHQQAKRALLPENLRVFGLLLLFLLGTAQAQQYEVIDRNNQSLANSLCVTCHGAYGQGNPVVGAPSLAGLEPWYIEKQLHKFRLGQRGVQGDYIPGYEMQAAVAAMDDAEINEVIANISTWQLVPAAPTLSGDVNRGGELYGSCATCHGQAGQGDEILLVPGLIGRDDWYLYRQLKLFKSGYRGGHKDDYEGAQMRIAVQVLATEQDILDVLSFVSELSANAQVSMNDAAAPL